MRASNASSTPATSSCSTNPPHSWRRCATSWMQTKAAHLRFTSRRTTANRPFMLKIILQDLRHLPPFNERARDLRVMNRPLWLNQRDVLAPYITRELEVPPGGALPE